MYKEHIDKAMELLQAMKDGASVFNRHKIYRNDDTKWHIVLDTSFDFDEFDYRAVYRKLTAEVFKREDCPEWAKWVAVFKDGRAFYFETKPFISGIYWCTECEYKKIGKFDATDWQNSLIERPVENKLPKWCKVGTKVFLGDFCTKIATINENEIRLECVVGYHSINMIVPAILELPTIDEIFQRSSLAVKHKKNDYYSTITGSNIAHQIYVSLHGNNPIKISELAENFTWSDGAPIGKYRPATKEEIEKMEKE